MRSLRADDLALGLTILAQNALQQLQLAHVVPMWNGRAVVGFKQDGDDGGGTIGSASRLRRQASQPWASANALDPRTFGRFWPHSQFCLLALSSPCSRTTSFNSNVGESLPASRYSRNHRRPNALDLLCGCLLGLHRSGWDGVLNTRPLL